MSEKKHLNRRLQSVPFRLKAISAVILSTALLSSAHGAGLGRINVLSALGQPLQAEIELHSTTKEQAEALAIRLAPLETFRMANIEYNPVLSALRFAVEDRNGQPVIRVSSTRPINEPFVDLLLEVEGNGGRLVREYTFILDPVDLRRPQSAQMAAVSAPAPVTVDNASAVPVVPSAPRAVVEVRPVAPATMSEPVAPSPNSSPLAGRAAPAMPAPLTESTPEQAAVTSYTVARGDTLGKIAREVAPEGVSLDQMLVALHRANPQAFSGDNMNRLRTGRILTVPAAEEARAVPQAEARRIVVAQANDFNQYKERLASQVAAAAPAAGEAARQSASGKISTQVEELGSSTAGVRDRLQLSKSGLADAGTDRAGAIPAGEEERIAQEKALAEANARIAELENNLSAMQRLLELQNKEMADQQAAAAALAPSVTKTVTPVVASAAEQEASPQPDEVATTAPTELAQSSPAETQAAPQPEAAAPVAATPAPVAKPKPAPAPVVKEPSFLDDVLGHPFLLPLTGILAALGLVGVGVRRRRKQQDALARDSFVQGNSLFGSTGGQSVDTNNSVFSTNFSPSASQLDANEVDPIAEADVYIAYQKDDQAEEILKDALRTQPSRHNVRLKLLEIYHRRNDAPAFAAGARELQVLTGGKGEEWLQAAAMGKALEPSNPLYGEAAAKNLGDPSNPSTEELDLGSLLNSTRLPQDDDDLPRASLSTASGGMDFNSEKFEAPAAKTSSLETNDPSTMDFELDIAGNEVKAGADETTSGSDSMIDWDVEKDIAQIKADASATDEGITFAAPQADPDDLDIISVLGIDETPDKPLEFDLSDIDLNVSAAKTDEAAEQPASTLENEMIDPLAQSISTQGLQEASAGEKDGKVEEKAEDAMPELKLDLSFEATDEPLLNLEIPAAPKASELSEPLAFSPPAGGAGLDEGAMWEESQDEVALAQYSIPLPSIGPISTETELSTKLDLAVAYREIGDKEGARELLEEVVASGHAEFAKKARDLLQKMA